MGLYVLQSLLGLLCVCVSWPTPRPDPDCDAAITVKMAATALLVAREEAKPVEREEEEVITQR